MLRTSSTNLCNRSIITTGKITSTDGVITLTSQPLNVLGITFSCQGTIQIDAGSTGFNPSSGKVVSNGYWHTVVVTYDGTTMKIYVDGTLENTASNWNTGIYSGKAISSTLQSLGNSNNYIGNWVDSPYTSSSQDRMWIGSIKNVKFYDYIEWN